MRAFLAGAGRMSFDPADVTRFWREAGKEAWFRKDAAFDAALRTRFLDAHMAAARRELDHWLDTGEGSIFLCLPITDRYIGESSRVAT